MLVALLFLRRTRGAALRTAALAALFAALANPTLREEERETLANIAIVVVDESTSQALASRPEQTAAIRDAAREKLSADPQPRGEMGDGASSFRRSSHRHPPLRRTLNTALADTPPDRIAGVIMVTDGQVHDVPKSAAALGFDAPVHALLTGSARRIRPPHRDPEGTALRHRRPVARHRSRASSKPARAGSRVATCHAEGPPRRPPDETFARPTSAARCTIEMPFPHAGTNILEVELDTAPGELTPANNRVVVAAEGVRENLRVLLVSGEPHAGERTWRNLLKSDAAVDLVHFTILRPPEKQDGTPINQLSLIAFPTRELFSEKINDFDLIIFDRYQHRGILQLLYYDNIARYVNEHGGARAGRRRRRLRRQLSASTARRSAPVLPGDAARPRASKSRSKPKLTDDGRKHPGTRAICPAPARKPTQPDLGPLVPPGRGRRPDRGRVAHDRRRRASRC